MLTRGAWLLPSLLAATPAAAQQVTNLTSGGIYTDLASAVAGAAVDDTLQIEGDLTGSVLVDRSLVLLGLPGAVLRTTGGTVLQLATNVDLTVDGVDFVGTNAQAILAVGGSNTLVVRDSVIDAGISPTSGVFGGAIRIEEPDSVELESVTFLGSAGQARAQLGGAIYAYATTRRPMTLTDVVFDRVESTGNGGAIYAEAMSVSCTRCTFDHTDGAFGGAIYAAQEELYVEQSLFCGSSGGLGGAIFSSADTEIRASTFQENTAASNGGALYANGGDWVVANNHFLGNGGTKVFLGSGLAASIVTTNNLFLGNLSEVLDLAVSTSPIVTYNWFWSNPSNSDLPLDATNITAGGDPDLVLWINDGDCGNDSLWPTPIASPLLDAGDPVVSDPDGSRSDIGAYGGGNADPYFHTDHDSDGPPFLHDCDDFDGANFPGNDELCDAIDNDCDGEIDENPIDLDEFFVDCDGDGQGVPGGGIVQCFPPEDPPCVGGGWASSQELGPLATADCDDTDPDIYTGAPEYCDVIDHDCDGDASEGAVDATTYFEDLDGDGYGTVTVEICADAPPPGYALVGGDCQDQDELSYPGAPDACGDGIDQDCNGGDGLGDTQQVWYPDQDGDGFGDPTQAPVLDCRPGAGQGYVLDATDCDDAQPQVYPGATEQCNERDDDCDGRVDNVGDEQTWYYDGDGDGFGDPETTLDADCAPNADWVTTAGDCDDDDPRYNVDCSTSDGMDVVVDEIKPSPTGVCGCAGGGSPAGGLATALGLLAVLGRRRRAR